MNRQIKDDQSNSMIMIQWLLCHLGWNRQLGDGGFFADEWLVKSWNTMCWYGSKLDGGLVVSKICSAVNPNNYLMDAAATKLVQDTSTVAPQMLRRAKVILPLASAVAWLPPLPRRDPVTAGRPTATQGRVITPIRCEVTIADQFLVEDMLQFGLVDVEVRSMALKKLEQLKQSERTWLGFGDGAKIAGKAAGVCLAAAYSPYLVLGKLGFGATGIAAGSMAASSQGTAVAAGSWFAWAQSTAATGLGFWKLGAASAGTFTFIRGATQGKCEREEWTDKYLLMTLVDQGLVDYEMRNLMLSKLQMRSRL